MSNCLANSWGGIADCLTILPIALPPDSSFDWIAPLTQFLVTLLAAALSYFVARYTVKKAAEIDKEQLRLERADEARSKALTVAIKITNYGDLLANVERHFTRQFRQAEIDGFLNGEPFQAIRPSQGRDFAPEVVNPSELSFLADLQKFELMSQVMLLYRRTLNVIHLITVHSKELVELEEWKQQLPGFKGNLDGDIANDGIPIEFADAFNRRAANLNILISEIVEQTDDTLELLPKVFQEYVQVCRAEFKGGFPQISFQYPREPITYEAIRSACLSSSIPFSISTAQSSENGNDEDNTTGSVRWSPAKNTPEHQQ